LRARPDLEDLGVVNKGIGGNRLLHDGNIVPSLPIAPIAPLFGESALARFDRDVLAQPGARYVIVLLGINDIGHPASGTAPASEAVTADDLIAAHRQLIERGHERGLKMFGATILPFEGDTLNFFIQEGEAKRQAVNRWIRTSGEYDGVIDFDRAVRDPAHRSDCFPPTTAVITCTPTTPAWPPWPTPSACASSAAPTASPTTRGGGQDAARVEAEDALGCHHGGPSREPPARASGTAADHRTSGLPLGLADG
jgi:hypothetical protein